ncbi:unnamed protein product [Cylicostephanus goldi]|uniref:Protein kinase domain-containing protein n=1 Tax=Cylicostephanus goldi TaxID=71465 RepID=A0A3P6T5P1_CYLGO|nr:unnamed protein product [Cylicostephanus goldi]
MDRYEIVRPVGQGAYGIVLQAKRKQDGRTVAIKKMTVTSRNQLQIVRELCALRNLHHPKVLKLLDVFCSRDSLSLVTEFVSFNLSDIIADPQRPQDDCFIRFFFRQILEGIKYIHSVDIMHRVCSDFHPDISVFSFISHASTCVLEILKKISVFDGEPSFLPWQTQFAKS